MAASKLYLDQRRPPRADGSFPLRVSFSHEHSTRYISLGVFLKPSEWNASARLVVSRPDRNFLNAFIAGKKQQVDMALLQLAPELPRLSASQLRDRILYEIEPAFRQRLDESKRFAFNFRRFADDHSASTREVYMATYRHLERFMGEAGLAAFSFEDVTRHWLTEFDKYLSRSSPSRNARNIHLRNIRAVMNDAIDNGLTQNYPFRKFKIKPAETLKRSLSVSQLRELFSFPVEDFQRQYVDFFKLIFFLCGINIIDLYKLQKIEDGRVSYHRSKTHKLYSVKVEPEALEIIERYRGRSALLNIADRYSNYKDFRHRLNENLQRIGQVSRVGRGGKKIITPLFPGLSTYWARHSWATIAAALDVPKETIAAALGHDFGNAVTSIYIRLDQSKVDEANRRVMDFVLYGK